MQVKFNTRTRDHLFAIKRVLALTLMPSIHSQRSSDTDDQGSLHRIAQNSQDKSDSLSKGDIVAVPAPIPDTGVSPTTTFLSSSHSALSAISTLPLTTTTFPHSSLTIPHSHASSISVTSNSSPSASHPTTSDRSHPDNHPLSVPFILAIAAGGAVALLGLLFVIKHCTRRKKVPMPVPSRPIFKDSYHDSNLMSPESPIFGGKERFSQKSHGERVPWTNYPHNAYAHVNQPVFPPVFNDPVAIPPQGDSSSIPKQMPQPVVPVRPVMRPPSMASVSLYPTSPEIEQVPAIFKRRRDSTQTMTDKHLRYSDLPYDGADIASPLIMPLPDPSFGRMLSTSNSNGGRTRIRSAYFTTGPYPPSALTHEKGVANASGMENAFDSQNSVYVKSEARRAHDTHALTSALGLTSPMPEYSNPVSPATIYPDDSLSMVGEEISHRRKSRITVNNAAVPPVPSISHLPDHDTGLALGNLMLADYSVTSRSLVTMGKKGPSYSRFSQSQAPSEVDIPSSNSFRIPRKAPRHSISEDPPRVPSPPPIPSLTQMAFEQSNPNGFSEYRSPTYSIYDFYRTGNDRKSRI